MAKLSYFLSSVRWKLSDGNSDASTPPQQLSDDHPVGANTDADCTARSSQLARIGARATAICSFVADQPAKDLDQYEECLELVCRGVVSGRVRVMLEHLRRMLDKPSTESGIVETASTSCCRPSFTSSDGNVNFVIFTALHICRAVFPIV